MRATATDVHAVRHRLKIRDMKQRYSQIAGVKNARKGDCGTILWGLENAAQASMDSQNIT